MHKARKYVVKNRFVGLPKREDFEVVEHELPPLKDGEILVKTEWISIDPYIRLSNSYLPLPYDQGGYQIGTVEESKCQNYPVGTKIVSYKGWRDYSILNGTIQSQDLGETFYPLPDLQGLPITYGINAVGMIGATAYFGLLEICKPKAGETVVVSGASGVIGSMVGQIAKVKGCRVIGFAGSDDKVEWLEKELGFDKVINYKTGDISKELKEAAPGGVDCYFDNIGGELSSAVMNQMNTFGRVAVCGTVSLYDMSGTPPKASMLQPAMVSKQLSVEGFVVWRWAHLWPNAFVDLTKWIKEDKIKVKEHITEGFNNLFDAFIKMSTNDDYGKNVLKV